MELILKITEACNFKCTFCSSTNITPADNRSKTVDITNVFQFLTRFPNTSTIIINGGDPLMVDIDYYWQLIEWLDKNNYSTRISFTSNLWPFYKDPYKWSPLFNNPRVGVTTSFNYGDTRRITETRVFTEDDFWDVSDTMLQFCNYRPDFISVINEENEKSAIDNVWLAKQMNVECKLNYAMASGAQRNPYQLSKIYQTYLNVYELGLTAWEFNTQQMIRRLKQGTTCCPQNRDCDSSIRSINPRLNDHNNDGYYSCGAFDDDNERPISFKQEVIASSKIFRPLQDDILIDAMHSGCYSCPMFQICNGCRKTVKDHKEANIVEQHCTLMKTLATRILSIQR